MSSVNFGRIFIFVLFVSPSAYVLVPLGGSATPSMLIGLLMFFWWLASRITNGITSSHSRQPIRIASYILITCVIASMSAAYSRILEPYETQAPLRGLTLIISFVGVCLFFADSLRNRDDVEKIVTAFIWGATFVASIGILEFITTTNIATSLKFPGLGSVGDVYLITTRNGLPRVAGTATHPIEYGAVLCVIWPFALRYAVKQWTTNARIITMLPVVLISIGLATAMSRTAAVTFIVIVSTLWFTWSPRRRFRFGVSAIFGVICLYTFLPEIPTGLIELFTKANQDVSVTARTDDYAQVREYLSQRFFFGMGYKTFDPVRYFFVDNQYLLSLIEIGVIGTLGLVGFMITAITLARNVKHTAKENFTRELGQCFASSLIAILICFATYDTLSFSMIALTTFMFAGTAAALWRINRFENGERDLEFPSQNTVINSAADSVHLETLQLS